MKQHWGYYTFVKGSGIVGIFICVSSWDRGTAQIAEIWKYISQVKFFIRFTMKCPVNTRQQTLHTVYKEQIINNKNINMIFFTKPHNVATYNRPASLI